MIITASRTDLSNAGRALFVVPSQQISCLKGKYNLFWYNSSTGMFGWDVFIATELGLLTCEEKYSYRCKQGCGDMQYLVSSSAVERVKHTKRTTYIGPILQVMII